MDPHFRAFSFVDRIEAIAPSEKVLGSYTIPADIPAFATSLVAEAVGQLAAWAAMARTNFERRPVAGLAGRIELLGQVNPGQVLKLAAELQSVDAEAVAYGGIGQVDGKPVMRLHDCVGPMVPVADFDDPEALRARFELLCSTGVNGGGFPGIPSLALQPHDGESGRSLRALFKVPESAVMFADHFPRRAVFPGSLLMHMNLELVGALATQIPAPTREQRWRLAAISDVKLRTFIQPGELLECETRLCGCSDDHALIAVETRKAKRIIGGAKVRLEPENNLP